MKLFLLPAKFKKVGIGIAVFTLIAALLCALIDYTYKPEYPPILKQLFTSFFCVALFCLNFYKHQIEDDKKLKIRMQSLMISFLFAIKYLLLISFMHLMDGEGLPNSAAEIIFLVLLFNLCVMIGLQSKPRKNEFESEPDVEITEN